MTRSSRRHTAKVCSVLAVALTAIGAAIFISAYKKIDFDYNKSNHYLTSASDPELQTLLDADALWVSNRPESFNAPGVFIQDQLSHENIRFLYHHKNTAKTAYNVHLQIKNTSQKTAALTIISGIGGPSSDEIYAGHMATRRFWLNASAPTGSIQLKLSPNEVYTVLDQRLDYGQISSGVIEFRSPDFKGIQLTFQALDPQFPQLTGFHDVTPTEFNARYYDNPTQTVSKSFKTTDRFITIPIGDQPFMTDTQTNIPLKGNYGLVYKVKLSVTNPTDDMAQLNVFLTPSGGNARVNYALNGHIFETEMLKGNETYVTSRKIFSTQLKPKTSDKIECIIMPQAGSFYPLTLMVKSGTIHQPDQ